MPSVLIAEDDEIQRNVVSQILRHDLGIESVLAVNGLEALNILKSDQGQRISLGIFDLRMPVMDGFSLLRQMRKAALRVPCIVMTSSNQLDDAVEVMQAGAADFITKPLERNRLVASVRNTLALSTLRQEVSKFKYDRFPRFTMEDIEESSPGLRAVCALARKAAGSTIPVLVSGESGVGKEVIAHAIHTASDRSGKPFISVNCGALPENLVESTLFGHEKGSFTGATAKALGKCREADGGVLFLDEIGELKLDAQVKLLRLLQEGEVEPVGAGRPVKVDVRIISATNRSLEDMVEQGLFREDLYYRLNGLPLILPPLRDRVSDIPALAGNLLERMSALESRPGMRLSRNAIEWMKSYDWPGNVREMQHMLSRAILLAAAEEITVEDLSRWARNGMRRKTDPVPAAVGGLSLRTPEGGFKLLKDIEEEIFEAALEHYDNHVGRAAAALGIGQSTLYKRVRGAKPETVPGNDIASGVDIIHSRH